MTEKRSMNVLGVVLALLLLGVVIFFAVMVNRLHPPTVGSADIGFLQDMIAHHEQAVDMALTLYDRTENETLRAMAADMMLTQQTQIGQMQGWLILWNAPMSNTDKPMTWMGMPVEGLMPGMATDEQLAALRASTGVESDRLFIELMIPHHQSALHMSQAVIERGSVPAVLDIARAMITAQEREIRELSLIAEELGTEIEPAATEEHNH